MSPNIDVMITAKTPFTQLENLLMTARADLNAPTYMLASKLVHNSNKVGSINGKLNLLSSSKLDGSVEVTTPIIGLEHTKIEYSHAIDSIAVQSSALLAYEDGRKVYSAELHSTISPSIDATLVVKTPVQGFTEVDGAFQFDRTFERIETVSSLTVEGRKVYSLSSGFDYSVEPMRFHTKVSAPNTIVRDVEMTLIHQGSLDNFKTVGYLNSPWTENVHAGASLVYRSLYDISASASMKSSMPNMDDLKFELKTSEQSGERRIHTVVGWSTDVQEVTVDIAHRVEDGWYDTAYHTDIALTTPFVALHKLGLQSEFHNTQTGRESKLTIEFNGVPTLDLAAEYNTRDRTEAKIVFKQPRPMTYTAGYSTAEGNFEGDLFLDWNRNDVHSNIRLTTNMADKSTDYVTEKSVDVTAECAQRKVGVTHTVKNTGSVLASAGKLFWDSSDGDQISYDLKMSERSRRNKDISDATLRLGLPSRTLELTGALVDSKVSKVADATFSWDVERDSKKKVGLKATLAKGETLRGDVTLSMPSLKKEIRVDGELMLQNGRVILDSKTDISYSSDVRKTLTLTSKVEDIADYSAHYNYSVMLGLSHPYTNLDLKLNSHFGSSEEKLTAGVETSYLTGRRQNKNLALLAEINKLRKQINLKMVSPSSKVEVMGDVVSTNPSKLRLVNRIDDKEVFTSDLTLDAEKKFAEINAIRGSDKWSLTAELPTPKEFRAYLSHNTHERNYYVKKRDAVFTAKLNTTRLLHSRLAWRPELLSEISAGFKQTSANLGYDALETWTLINADIADELAAKYQVITAHLEEELTPIINALERELTTVAHRMNEISEQLKTIYDNNDFYVHSMADQFTALQQKYDTLVSYYRRTYSEIISSWRQCLNDLGQYPIRAEYKEMVKSTMADIAVRLLQAAEALEVYTEKIEMTLLDYKQRTQKYAQQTLDAVKNSTSNFKLNEITNIDISPYTTSFEIPEVYSNAIKSVENTAMSGLQYVWERPELDMMRGNLNSIYQEGKWAFQYWDVKENIKTNLDNIFKLLVEIVEDESKEIIDDLKSLYNIKNPITVWQQGEIQADFPLPIEVRRLDEVPDFSPITKKAKRTLTRVAAYLPNQASWESFKEIVSKMLPAREELLEDDSPEMLKKYNSTRRTRIVKKVKKPRKMKKFRM